MPRERKKRRKASPSTPSSPPPTPAGSSEAMEVSVAPAVAPPPAEDLPEEDAAADDDGFTVVTQKRVPPLVVRGQEYLALAAVFEHLNMEFKCTNSKDDHLSFKCESMEDYRTGQAYLKENSMEFYSFNLKSERDLKYVIRGIPKSTSPADWRRRATSSDTPLS